MLSEKQKEQIRALFLACVDISYIELSEEEEEYYYSLVEVLDF